MFAQIFSTREKKDTSFSRSSKPKVFEKKKKSASMLKISETEEGFVPAFVR